METELAALNKRAAQPRSWRPRGQLRGAGGAYPLFRHGRDVRGGGGGCDVSALRALLSSAGLRVAAGSFVLPRRSLCCRLEERCLGREGFVQA